MMVAGAISVWVTWTVTELAVLAFLLNVVTKFSGLVVLALGALHMLAFFGVHFSV